MRETQPTVTETPIWTPPLQCLQDVTERAIHAVSFLPGKSKEELEGFHSLHLSYSSSSASALGGIRVSMRRRMCLNRPPCQLATWAACVAWYDVLRQPSYKTTIELHTPPALRRQGRQPSYCLLLPLLDSDESRRSNSFLQLEC